MKFVKAVSLLLLPGVMCACLGCGEPAPVTKDPVKVEEANKKQEEMSKKERG